MTPGLITVKQYLYVRASLLTGPPIVPSWETEIALPDLTGGSPNNIKKNNNLLHGEW
jgi:hypothetical protein